jgi:hypothetical protein
VGDPATGEEAAMIPEATPPEQPTDEAGEAPTGTPPDPDLAALLAAEAVANDYHPGRGD